VKTAETGRKSKKKKRSREGTVWKNIHRAKPGGQKSLHFTEADRDCMEVLKKITHK